MTTFSEGKSRLLRHAVRQGDLALVQSLSLDPEADLNYQDSDGFTPFLWACFLGHVDIVRFLLDFEERKIDYNLDNDFGFSPFHGACEGKETVVEMLLNDERIDINHANIHQETPLWFSSYWGKLRVVKLLLASGREIDVYQRDRNEKKTAAGIAKERRKIEVASLLESFERDPQAVRAELRKELGYLEPLAGELFALVVYLSDGYLEVDPNRGGRSKAQAFFSLATQLPLELQMVLCNRVFGLRDSIIKHAYSERGFKKFARGF